MNMPETPDACLAAARQARRSFDTRAESRSSEARFPELSGRYSQAVRLATDSRVMGMACAATCTHGPAKPGLYCDR